MQDCICAAHDRIIVAVHSVVIGTSRPLAIAWIMTRLRRPCSDLRATTIERFDTALVAFLRVPPGNRLEALAGNRAGQHSVRVDDQWRICFRWRDGNAYDVEFCDYH